MSLFLTPEERRRFVDYCRREADSCAGMAEQMEKMAGAVGAELAKRERMRGAAYAIVARDLDSVEDMTIGAPPP